MGPNQSLPKSPTKKISEEQILKQSQIFIKDNGICEKDEECYNWIRLTLAKINLYGHKALLAQIKQCPDKLTKLHYLQKWRTISFQNLDLLFQNLIKNTITKVDENITFNKIEPHQKYSLTDREQLKRLSLKGQTIIRNKRVAVLIFVGSSSTKSESIWDKQFHKESQSQKNLFQIIMQRLQEIGNKLGFPPTYLFYDRTNSDKVNKFIKTYSYGDKLHCCVQSNHPILNLNGSVCLKEKNSAQILQMPNGAGDFYHATIKGMSILQKLKKQNIQYVNCVNCQNMLEMVLDPYMVGLFDMNKNDFDLMYKCTYPENQNQRIFKRVTLQNGYPKGDTIPNLTSFVNNYNKQSGINTQNIRESPVWMGHLIFDLQKVQQILHSAQSMSYFPQAVNYQLKQMTYWSPIEDKFRKDEAVYVFDKDLSDLLLNNLFKSKGIMVEREEEYLPIITKEGGEYSWRSAYKEYTLKQKKNLGLPFYQRIQRTNMMESMIRGDESGHYKPN